MNTSFACCFPPRLLFDLTIVLEEANIAHIGWVQLLGVSTAQDNGRSGYADVWKRGYFAWEYKGKHADLESALGQLLRYQRNLGIPPLLVVCDFDRYQIHTNWPDTVQKVYEFTNDDLVEPAQLWYLQKLVFATLWQASERWQNVKMSEIECSQLDHLRRELKLEDQALTKPEPVKAAA